MGGSSLTADILVDNSGNEVASATRMLPTKRRPHPVRVARASPYLASRLPQKITATALPRNMPIASARLISIYEILLELVE